MIKTESLVHYTGGMVTIICSKEEYDQIVYALNTIAKRRETGRTKKVSEQPDPFYKLLGLVPDSDQTSRGRPIKSNFLLPELV